MKTPASHLHWLGNTVLATTVVSAARNETDDTKKPTVPIPPTPALGE